VIVEMNSRRPVESRSKDKPVAPNLDVIFNLHQKSNGDPANIAGSATRCLA
jgi:hypothetical protein